MNQQSALQDLEYIRGVLDRTERRVDTHAFHLVHWGAIVLVWFPLANYFQESGNSLWQVVVGIASIVLGATLSGFREFLLSKRPRLEAENTFVTTQVCWVVYPLLGAGFVLSFVAPATEFIRGEHVPVIWGGVYAVMAFMIGVVYKREFMISGAAIFAGVIVAMIIPRYCGYILGPLMGLGLIIPGWIAERRVRRLQEETGVAPTHEPV